jgi:hypothetical protein
MILIGIFGFFCIFPLANNLAAVPIGVIVFSLLWHITRKLKTPIRLFICLSAALIYALLFQFFFLYTPEIPIPTPELRA